jgi:Cu/Ag efflux pump CusA
VDRAALARYGLNVTDVQQAVSSAGSGETDFATNKPR